MRNAKKLRTVALVVAALLLLSTASASGADKIGGNKIKKNAIASKHIKNNAVQGGEIKNGTVASGDIKNGTVASGDLANGSVTAGKIAPEAIAFPNSLWGPMIRNQTGGAESNGQTGPTGQPEGDGSLRLAVTGPADLAAFGNSFDFAGVQLDQITDVSYATYNGDATPLVRPSLRVEINPHLVDDATPLGGLEFTTLIHQPEEGATGWETHADALADDLWYLTGDEGTDISCTQDATCTFDEVLTALEASTDDDPAPPAVSTGVYFGLGSGVAAPTETAVDAFVLNGFLFDFEPVGVFLTPAP